jgi:hypothetical protein
MNLWKGHGFKLFLVIFAAEFGLAGGPGIGQEGDLTQAEKPSAKINQAQPVKVKLNPNAVRVKTLSPIPFKAFSLEEFRDPKTGLAIAAESDIILKNGKKIRGKAFLAEVNALEAKFNELGYTLRKPQNIKIQESVFDRDLLERQRQSLRAERLKNPAPSASKPLSGLDLPTYHGERLRLAPARIRMIEQFEAKHKPEFKPLHKQQSYNYTWGDKGLFAASHQARVALDGRNKDKVSVSAEGGAVGYLFGHPFDLINIHGSAEAQKVDMQATFTASALGDDFSPIHKAGKGQLNISDQKVLSNRSLPCVSLDFPIGPIPITVTFGLAVKASASYGASLTPLDAAVTVKPEVSTELYADFAVDLEIVSVILEGHLTLLDDSQNLNAKLSQDVGDQPEPYFSGEYSGWDHMSTLDGHVDVVAEVDLWLWSDSWTWEVFSWGGIADAGFIIPRDKFTEPLYKGTKAVRLRVTIDRLTTSYHAGFLTSEVKFGESGSGSAPVSLSNRQSTYAPHWVHEKQEIVSADDKVPISIMICHSDKKPPFEKNNIRKCGEPIKVSYDFMNHRFSGTVEGKAGETITVKGVDGEIQFKIEELPVFGAPTVAK